jgi:hypothetical protein
MDGSGVKWSALPLWKHNVSGYTAGAAPGTGSGSTVDWWIGGRTMGGRGLKPAK